MRHQSDIFQTLSKDPDGFNLSFEENVGLDPTGFRPSHPLSPNEEPQFGDVDYDVDYDVNHGGNHGGNQQQASAWIDLTNAPDIHAPTQAAAPTQTRTNNPIDVAKLVGAPPPPPPMPPPNRSRSRQRQRPRPRPEDAFQPFGADEPVAVIDVEVPQVVNRKLSSAAAPSSAASRLSPLSASQFGTEASKASGSVAASPSSAVTSNAKPTVAEERRRAALAMYESDALVLDQNAPSVAASASASPSTAPSINNDETMQSPAAGSAFKKDFSFGLSYSEDIENTTPEKMPTDGDFEAHQAPTSMNGTMAKAAALKTQQNRAALASPRSAATQQHSNKTSRLSSQPVALSRKTTAPAPTTVPNTSNTSNRRALAKSPNNMQPSKQSTVTTTMTNSTSTNTNTKTSRSNTVAQTTRKPEKKAKRGFLKKIFGGGSSKKSKEPKDAKDTKDTTRKDVSGARSPRPTTPVASAPTRASTPSANFAKTTRTSNSNTKPHAQQSVVSIGSIGSSKASSAKRHTPIKPLAKPVEAANRRTPSPSPTNAANASRQTQLQQQMSMSMSLSVSVADESAAHSAASASHVSGAESNAESNDQFLDLEPTLTMDPPDLAEDHADPPILSLANNDPPLQLNFSEDDDDDDEEMRRIESVRSRISGIYKQHTGTNHQHAMDADAQNSNGDVFFSSKDAFAMTPQFAASNKATNAPSEPAAATPVFAESLSFAAKASSPLDANGEPGGEYVHPLSARFSQITQATPSAGLTLNVNSMKSVDPAGDSPMHETLATPGSKVAKSKPQPNAFILDPLGDSPMASDAFVHTGVNHFDPVGEPAERGQLEPRNTAAADGNNVNHSIVDDPPLQLFDGYISEDSTDIMLEMGNGGEEKKEDDDDLAQQRMAVEPPTPVTNKLAPMPGKLDTSRPTTPPSPPAAAAAANPPDQEATKQRDPTPKSSNSTATFQSRFYARPKSGNNSKPPSKATLAALRLTKAPAIDSLKDQLDKIPTPKHDDDSRVGSAPVADGGKSESKVSKTHRTPAKTPPRNTRASKLQIDTAADIENETEESTAKKQLSVTAAAFTNAKAVAYLHKLQGSPSPRHSWHKPKQQLSEDESKRVQELTNAHRKLNSAAKAKKNSEAAAKATPSKPIPPPSPYGWQDKYAGTEIDDPQREFPPNKKDLVIFKEDLYPPAPPTPEDVTNRIVGSKLRGYRSNFKGRRPGKKKEKADAAATAEPSATADEKLTIDAVPDENGITLGNRLYGGANRSNPNIVLDNDLMAALLKHNPPKNFRGAITSLAVSKGIKLRKKKRCDDIASGRSTPVILTPRSKPTGGNRFNFVPADESEIKDPIQRAGRRLLSKAAIPIQCAARRFIAKRDAVDRMWALIEIQSYFRRWRAETNLQAYTHSATIIQSHCRSYLTRKRIDEMHFAATDIQKIIRGYLASAHVYDQMYFLVQIQSTVRMFLGKRRAKLHKRRIETAVPRIQAQWRGYKCREAYRENLATATAAVTMIQSQWRSYEARVGFQFTVVDVIIVQSTFRRWYAQGIVEQLKFDRTYNAATKIQAAYRAHHAFDEYVQFKAARKIQATWRGHHEFETYSRFTAARKIQSKWRGHKESAKLAKFKAARKIQTAWRGHVKYSEFQRIKAVTKIQAAWRGFQCYTDYIFCLVDVLVIQRAVRQWIAARKTHTMRQQHAAVRIQREYRRHRAQTQLVYTMAQIIITQSVARRYNSRYRIQERHADQEAERQVELNKERAVTKIQAVWRGFWGFSHYIIMQYEITRIQAAIRGKLARQSYGLRLGCAIIIQATVRQHQAKNLVKRKKIDELMFAGDVLALREKSAATKIQFWWRIVMDWTREKKAALVIERFFYNLLEDVKQAVIQKERRRKSRKEKKRRRKKQSEDQLLERVWLKTVDEETMVDTIGEEILAASESNLASPKATKTPRSAAAKAAATAAATATAGASASTPTAIVTNTSGSVSTSAGPPLSRPMPSPRMTASPRPIHTTSSSRATPTNSVSSRNNNNNSSSITTPRPTTPNNTSNTGSSPSKARRGSPMVQTNAMGMSSPRTATSPRSRQQQQQSPVVGHRTASSPTNMRNRTNRSGNTSPAMGRSSGQASPVVRPHLAPPVGARTAHEHTMPTDTVQIAPSEDASEISNITNPSVFHKPQAPPASSTAQSAQRVVQPAKSASPSSKRMEPKVSPSMKHKHQHQHQHQHRQSRHRSRLQPVSQAEESSLADEEDFLDLKPRSKPMTTEDYIRKYSKRSTGETSERTKKMVAAATGAPYSTPTSTASAAVGKHQHSNRPPTHFSFDDASKKAAGSSSSSNHSARHASSSVSSAKHSSSGNPRSMRSHVPSPRTSGSPRNSNSTAPGMSSSTGHQRASPRAIVASPHMPVQRSNVPPSPTARSTKSNNSGSFFPSATSPSSSSSSHMQRQQQQQQQHQQQQHQQQHQQFSSKLSQPPRHSKSSGTRSPYHLETLDTALTQNTTMTPTSSTHGTTIVGGSGSVSARHRSSPVKMLSGYHGDHMEHLDLLGEELGDEYGEV